MREREGVENCGGGTLEGYVSCSRCRLPRSVGKDTLDAGMVILEL